MKRMIKQKTNEGTLQSFNGDKLIKFARFVSKYEDDFQEIKKIFNITCSSLFRPKLDNRVTIY